MHALTQLARVWAHLSTPNPALHLSLALLGIMKSCECVYVGVCECMCHVCVGVEDYSRNEKNKSYLHSKTL